MPSFTTSRTLISLDKFCDYIPIPGLSLLNNSWDIIYKYRYISKKETDELIENFYYVHLQHKSFTRCICFIVPIVGPIFILISDLCYRLYGWVQLKRANKITITDQRSINKRNGLLQKATDAGAFARTQFALLLPSNGIQRIKHLMRAAAEGEQQALSLLANAYQQGDVIPKDLTKAAELYQLAVNQGCPQSAYFLGEMYDNGNGVTQDKKRAAKLYQLAVKHGHAGAQFALGKLTELGEGVGQDTQKAITLYDLSAEQNNSDALVRRAHFCLEKVEESAKQAKEYLRKAAAQGNIQAIHVLAILESDADKQFDLAERYSSGDGVEQDFKKAFELYESAANLQHELAQHMLAIFYAQGIGVEKNLVTAMEFYQLSAKNGCVDAQLYLGKLYSKGTAEDGMQVKVNLKRSDHYYRLAATQGDEEAGLALQERRKKLKKKGKTSEVQRQQEQINPADLRIKIDEPIGEPTGIFPLVSPQGLPSGQSPPSVIEAGPPTLKRFTFDVSAALS